MLTVHVKIKVTAKRNAQQAKCTLINILLGSVQYMTPIASRILQQGYCISRCRPIVQWEGRLWCCVKKSWLQAIYGDCLTTTVNIEFEDLLETL